MRFKIIPIPVEVAEEARASGRAPHFGHPTHPHTASAEGYGPCRLCLQRTRAGERRVLLTYNPTRDLPGIPFGGPIVVHQEACEPYAGHGVPEGWEGLPIALCGHLEGGAGLVFREASDGLEAGILDLFRDPRVAFITLRNTDPDSACYIARVERA